ncbi:hypothetical protein, partial [Pseudorhizobium pelagicum]|uniref:hypothetical protein n=1 Tax=Pseudorhizobium pelagicum TaxID=1509405 RepID=UPI001AEC5F4A
MADRLPFAAHEAPGSAVARNPAEQVKGGFHDSVSRVVLISTSRLSRRRSTTGLRPANEPSSLNAAGDTGMLLGFRPKAEV